LKESDERGDILQFSAALFVGDEDGVLGRQINNSNA
jgi:ribosomal protein S5